MTSTSPAPDTRPWRHLYGTKRWQNLREQVLCDQPLCVMCLASDVVEMATVVDHIIPHKGDLDIFFDRENLQGLCKPHHDRDKALIERGRTMIQFDAAGWPI